MTGVPRGARAWGATALVVVAVWGSILAISGLLSPGRWGFVAGIAVLLLAVVVAGVRAVTRSWWAPSLTGLVVAVVGVAIMYGGAPGRTQILPTPTSLGRLGTLADEALALIDASVVPMAPSRPVELLVVGGSLLVFLAADLLAVGLGTAAWSGLPLLGLWIPGIFLAHPATPWALVWSAGAYLLLLALTATPSTSRGDTRRRAPVALAATAGVIVTALVAGPAIAAAPGWASFDLPDFGSGPIGPVRLSEDLDLRESLGQRSRQVVLTYTTETLGGNPEGPAGLGSEAPGSTATPVGGTDARTVGPLRAFTLRDFDGRSWSRADEANELLEVTEASLLSQDPVTRGSDPTEPRDPSTSVATVDVLVGALRDDHLPISTYPRSVTAEGVWQYDPQRDEVLGDRNTRSGYRYSMTVQIPELTKEDLLAVTGTPDADPRYLAVPSTTHTDDVRERALEVTEDAQGQYEQALALQTYFRDTRNFEYDTRVPPARSDDAVWDFLEDRTGYCVQYATSMTVMARALGIPARLAVGFLPGTLDAEGQYVVTGRLSHAWPELLFPEIGWVRFEPTPAVQTGPPPRWSDPFEFSTNRPTEGAPTGDPSRGQLPQATSSGQQQETPQSQAPAFPLPLAIGVAALIVVLSVGAVLMARRAAQPSRLTPEAAWSRLRERLAAAGIAWPDSRTPRQAVELVRAQVLEKRGEPLPERADAALVDLARAVEDERYAPVVRPRPSEELEEQVGEVLQAVNAPTGDRARS